MVFFDDKRIYSEKEAATILGMTTLMLARRRRAGKIDCVKDGHFIGYTQKHLDAYCQKFGSDKLESTSVDSLAPNASARTSKKSSKQFRRKPIYGAISASRILAALGESDGGTGGAVLANHDPAKDTSGVATAPRTDMPEKGSQ